MPEISPGDRRGLSCDYCDQRFYTPNERVFHVRFEHRDGKTSDEYWSGAPAAERFDPQYDVTTDTVIIFGVRYAVGLFRTLAFGPIGSAFRIVGRDDGTVMLQSLNEESFGDGKKPT